MALAADTAIVTAAEVAAITGEAGLSNLDDSASGATLAAALLQATNFLIVDLKHLGKVYDPSKVSNTSDLKIAAAAKAAVLRLGAQPDASSQARTVRLEALYQDQLKKYVFESTDGGDEQLVGEFGTPRVFNTDSGPVFGPTDNSVPGATRRDPWLTKWS